MPTAKTSSAFRQAFAPWRASVRVLAVLLAFALAVGPLMASAADSKPSLFDRLKAKTEAKIAQFKDRDWLFSKLGGKLVGLVCGKAGGLLGAAVGIAAGALVGGPLAMGIGAFLGFRVGDILTKAFTRPWGELMASNWREGKQFKPLASWKALDKKGLMFEGACAVAGDLFGELVGVSVGMALFAGAGTLSIPLMGAVSLGVAGVWLGTKLGRGLGRWIGRHVPGWFGRGAKAPQPISTASTAAPAVTPAPSGTVIAVSTHLETLQQRYQKAYADYVALVTDTNATPMQRENALAVYKQAAEDYRSAQAAGVR